MLGEKFYLTSVSDDVVYMWGEKRKISLTSLCLCVTALIFPCWRTYKLFGISYLMTMSNLPPNIWGKCLQIEHVLRHKQGI